jgi:hypothetical protein
MYGQQKRNMIHTSSTAYEQDHSAAAHNPRARRPGGGSCCNLMDCTMLLHTAHLSMSLIQIDLAVDFVVLRGLPGDCGRGRRDISRLRIAMLNA